MFEKKALLTCALSVLAIGLSAVQANAQEPELADAVYLNGEVYTVESDRPWVEAVAIDDGKFVFVGSNKDVRAHIGPNTLVVDLGGKMAMPGLHDAHQHLMKGQNRFIYCQVSPHGDIKELIKRLKACGPEKLFGKWLVADVYNGENFPGGVADRKYLDEAFPDTPVYIREWSYHHGLANTRALEIAGITRDTPDPEAGHILHRKDGEPTGELLSKATWLVSQHIPPPSDDVVRAALLRTAGLAIKNGITSVQDAASDELAVRIAGELDREGRWPLRTAMHVVWGNSGSSLMSTAAIDNYLAHRQKFATSHVLTDFVKLYVDGSPLQPHATDVQVDAHNEVDLDRLYDKPEVIAAALTHFDEAGIKVKMHAVGSGAIRVALDGVSAMRKVNGMSKIMPDIAHNLFYTEEDLDRAAQLHVVAEMSPAIWQIEGPLTRNLKGAWPFRSLLDKGTLLTLGSDWVVLDEPNLFPAIGGMLAHGDESIELAEALKIATLNGAVSVGWDNVNGSIKVGKFANMIVLDQNLFKIDPSKIGSTKVLMTIFEGDVVYQP